MLKLLTLNAFLVGKAFGNAEPQGYWFGDLDPKTRSLQGQITIRPPSDALGLTGYKLYPTGDGSTALALDFADGSSTGAAGTEQYELVMTRVGGDFVHIFLMSISGVVFLEGLSILWVGSFHNSCFQFLIRFFFPRNV